MDINFTAYMVIWWNELDYDVHHLYKIESEAAYIDLNLVEEKMLEYAEETSEVLVEESLEAVGQQLDFTFTYIESFTDPDKRTIKDIDHWMEF